MKVTFIKNFVCLSFSANISNGWTDFADLYWQVAVVITITLAYLNLGGKVGFFVKFCEDEEAKNVKIEN